MERKEMLAIINAELHTCGPQGTIPRATVLLQDSKISAIGKDLFIPDQAQVLDVAGMTVTPGFIDAHTHLGMAWQVLAGETDINENTGVVNSHLRALDAIDPKDIAFDDAVAGGVTTVMVHPGKLMIGNQTISPIAGQSVVLKTRGDVGHREILRQPAGIKMALGDQVAESLSKRNRGPNSRMGIAALIRSALREAQEYQRAEQDKNGTRSLRMEALSRLLSRELTAHIHVHRADDIRTALSIADEFNLDIALEHATEGEFVASEIAARGIPCVVGPTTVARERKRELKNLSHKIPGVLAAAGVKVALMTDHPTEAIQFLPIIAGQAVREGMDPGEALKAITIYPAEILRVADRVGSVEPGKDADLVVHEGDPLEAMTRIRLVVADGKVVVNEL